MGTKLTAFQIVKAIQAELDGREWTPDTLDAIADILRANGIPRSVPRQYVQCTHGISLGQHCHDCQYVWDKFEEL